MPVENRTNEFQIFRLRHNILKNEDVMKDFSKTFEIKLDKFLRHKTVVMKIKEILDDIESGTTMTWIEVDDNIQNEYSFYFETPHDNKEELYVKKFRSFKIFIINS